ncbi:MAG TPA: hypothetical protein VGA50_04675 [Kiloniellales bacterium]
MNRLSRFLPSLFLAAVIAWPAAAQEVLRQSTARTVTICRIISVTDATTPVTNFTLSGADEAEALKANGAATVDISGATWTAITGADGCYTLALTSSHTDTVGSLRILLQDDSLILPREEPFLVVEEAVHDALWASGAAVLSSDVASRMNRSAATMALATVNTGSSATSIIVSSLDPASSVNDQWNGRVLAFPQNTTTAALRGQAKRITDFDHATQTFTVDAFTTAPASGDIAIIF